MATKVDENRLLQLYQMLYNSAPVSNLFSNLKRDIRKNSITTKTTTQRRGGTGSAKGDPSSLFSPLAIWGYLKIEQWQEIFRNVSYIKTHVQMGDKYFEKMENPKKFIIEANAADIVMMLSIFATIGYRQFNNYIPSMLRLSPEELDSAISFIRESLKKDSLLKQIAPHVAEEFEKLLVKFEKRETTDPASFVFSVASNSSTHLEELKRFIEIFFLRLAESYALIGAYSSVYNEISLIKLTPYSSSFEEKMKNPVFTKAMANIILSIFSISTALALDIPLKKEYKVIFKDLIEPTRENILKIVNSLNPPIDAVKNMIKGIVDIQNKSFQNIGRGTEVIIKNIIYRMYGGTGVEPDLALTRFLSDYEKHIKNPIVNARFWNTLKAIYFFANTNIIDIIISVMETMTETDAEQIAKNIKESYENFTKAEEQGLGDRIEEVITKAKKQLQDIVESQFNKESLQTIAEYLSPKTHDDMLEDIQYFVDTSIEGFKQMAISSLTAGIEYVKDRYNNIEQENANVLTNVKRAITRSEYYLNRGEYEKAIQYLIEAEELMTQTTVIPSEMGKFAQNIFVVVKTIDREINKAIYTVGNETEKVLADAPVSAGLKPISQQYSKISSARSRMIALQIKDIVDYLDKYWGSKQKETRDRIFNELTIDLGEELRTKDIIGTLEKKKKSLAMKLSDLQIFNTDGIQKTIISSYTLLANWNAINENKRNAFINKLIEIFKKYEPSISEKLSSATTDEEKKEAIKDIIKFLEGKVKEYAETENNIKLIAELIKTYSSTLDEKVEKDISSIINRIKDLFPEEASDIVSALQKNNIQELIILLGSLYKKILQFRQGATTPIANILSDLAENAKAGSKIAFNHLMLSSKAGLTEMEKLSKLSALTMTLSKAGINNLDRVLKEASKFATDDAMKKALESSAENLKKINPTKKEDVRRAMQMTSMKSVAKSVKEALMETSKALKSAKTEKEKEELTSVKEALEELLQMYSAAKDIQKGNIEEAKKKISELEMKGKDKYTRRKARDINNLLAMGKKKEAMDKIAELMNKNINKLNNNTTNQQINKKIQRIKTRYVLSHSTKAGEEEAKRRMNSLNDKLKKMHNKLKQYPPVYSEQVKTSAQQISAALAVGATTQFAPVNIYRPNQTAIRNPSFTKNIYKEMLDMRTSTGGALLLNAPRFAFTYPVMVELSEAFVNLTPKFITKGSPSAFENPYGVEVINSLYRFDPSKPTTSFSPQNNQNQQQQGQAMKSTPVNIDIFEKHAEKFEKAVRAREAIQRFNKELEKQNTTEAVKELEKIKDILKELGGNAKELEEQIKEAENKLRNLDAQINDEILNEMKDLIKQTDERTEYLARMMEEGLKQPPRTGKSFISRKNNTEKVIIEKQKKYSDLFNKLKGSKPIFSSENKDKGSPGKEEGKYMKVMVEFTKENKSHLLFYIPSLSVTDLDFIEKRGRETDYELELNSRKVLLATEYSEWGAQTKIERNKITEKDFPFVISITVLFDVSGSMMEHIYPLLQMAYNTIEMVSSKNIPLILTILTHDVKVDNIVHVGYHLPSSVTGKTMHFNPFEFGSLIKAGGGTMLSKQDAIKVFGVNSGVISHLLTTDFDRKAMFLDSLEQSQRMAGGIPIEALYVDNSTIKSLVHEVPDRERYVSSLMRSLVIYIGDGEIDATFKENPHIASWITPVLNVAVDNGNPENMARALGIHGRPNVIGFSTKDLWTPLPEQMKKANILKPFYDIVNRAYNTSIINEVAQQLER